LTAAITARDGLVTSTQIAAADRYITRRRHELEAATGEELRLEASLDEHQSVVSGAQRTLARARADREVIERHFERWRQARRIAAERREE
jgi:multidrug resistance efflux pump